MLKLAIFLSAVLFVAAEDNDWAKRLEDVTNSVTKQIDGLVKKVQVQLDAENKKVAELKAEKLSDNDINPFLAEENAKHEAKLRLAEKYQELYNSKISNLELYKVRFTECANRIDRHRVFASEMLELCFELVETSTRWLAD